MAALIQLYPETFASCLYLSPCVYGSGGDGDGGGLCPGPGSDLGPSGTEPSRAVPGHTPSARPPGSAAASARRPSA